MFSTVLITTVSLSVLALVSAVILYFVAQKFKVIEDSRIDDIQAVLPSANCGGCGYAGCRSMAEALVKSESFDGLICPVGGAAVMDHVAKILGRVAPVVDPMVAVLKCNGTPMHRPRTSKYDGAPDCRITNNLYIGESDCSFGCLGNGDCERVCPFNSIHIDPSSGLPVVNDSTCNGCGTCVKACPRKLIELRKKAKKDRKIYVACSNCDKGAVARKACKVACIACNKCVKVCAFNAITVENNLAYIDASKCTFCRKCVAECPVNSILELNFPPRKEKEIAQAETISA